MAFPDAKFDCVQIVDLRLSPILQIMSNIKLQSKQIIWGGRSFVWCSLQLFVHTSTLIVWIKQIQSKADINTVTKHCQIFHLWTFCTRRNTACFLLKSWSVFELKKKKKVYIYIFLKVNKRVPAPWDKFGYRKQEKIIFTKVIPKL